MRVQLSGGTMLTDSCRNTSRQRWRFVFAMLAVFLSAACMDGYKLARNVSDITIADIVRASEQGELRGVSCERDSMNERQGAMTHELWRAFHQTVDDYLQSVSLADVVREHLAKGDTEEGLRPSAPAPKRRPLHPERQLPVGDVPNSVFALGRTLGAR